MLCLLLPRPAAAQMEGLTWDPPPRRPIDLVPEGEGEPAEAPLLADPGPPSSSRAARGGSLALALTGTAMVAGAFAWDASLYGTRRDLERQATLCRLGTCDIDRLNDLQARLDRSRVERGLLTACGAVMAASGWIWHYTTRNWNRQWDVTLDPLARAGSFRIRF
jgi:hypothetical protein